MDDPFILKNEMMTQYVALIFIRRSSIFKYYLLMYRKNVYTFFMSKILAGNNSWRCLFESLVAGWESNSLRHKNQG